MTPTRYPLQWPAGWKRTAGSSRTDGRFTTKRYSNGNKQEPVTVAESVDRLLAELQRMGIAERDVIISTNVEPTLSGRPRSGERMPADPGAAVYWHDHGAVGGPQDRCMAIDRYTKVEQNIAALAATIEAMRAIERHGGAAILNRAFTGFTALPAPIVAGMKMPWREVLGLARHSGNTPEEVQTAYRRLASQFHPDRGGSPEKMAELNAARDEALKELGDG